MFIEEINITSRPSVVYRIVVLKNSRNSKENTCVGDSVIMQPATLFKERHWHECFPANFRNFLRTAFFVEHLPATDS